MTARPLRGWGLAAIVVATLLLGASAETGHGRATAGPTVHTPDGVVRGLATGGVDAFRGIPYAKAPVGDLRWRPPVPVAPWTGVRQATAFAAHCAQPSSSVGVASTSEDCLYLNVFAPTDKRSELPVMVWLHGGALVYGESDDFNPAPLVAHGVIVVTVNYRLGALGFLADAALADSSGAAGNYGLMDQQAALRWVRAAIAGFGGDPGNVTLFGESAGGLSVLAQLVSPGARGLMNRAISQSGTYAMATAPLAAAESAGESFARRVGCSGAGEASCLRALPVTTILANERIGGYLPNVDGEVLTETLHAAFSRGDFDHVPVIMGTNRDEYRSLLAPARPAGEPPLTRADYAPLLSETLGVSTPPGSAIAARYPLDASGDTSLPLAAAATDAIFACPALATDGSLAAYAPTYAYEFADERAPERYLAPTSYSYGAAHASELSYLFDLRAPRPAVLSPAQRTLSADMVGYWTSFARSGIPTARGAAEWPPFRADSPAMLSLNTPAPSPDTDFAAYHQCAFWSDR